MSIDIVVPASAWEGVDAEVQGVIDAWLVAEGAAVEAGQPLVRALLIKSTIEVEAMVSGRLEKILLRAGENFARGQTLGWIAAQ